MAGSGLWVDFSEERRPSDWFECASDTTCGLTLAMDDCDTLQVTMAIK
ncbi:MAG: hypothetical protein AAB263_09525 [Planctomycetota bacterium]